MKIKISEVNQMIKEEFQKLMEKKKLSTRLNQINEELSKMEAEDKALNEVEAGSQTSVSSHAWTGEAGGDKKWKPEFEKKGTHLKEDDMPGEEVASAEVEEKPMGEFEAKFAEIGRAIDAKMAAEAGAEAGAGEVAASTEEPTEDDFEEVEVEGPKGEEGEEEGEIEEYKELVGGVGAEQGMTASDAVKKEDVDASQHLNPKDAIKSTEEDSKLKGEVQESVEEPIEGHSVAQEVEADKVNDNMEKDKHVKEGENKKGAVITEAKTPESKNIFTEGVDEAKKAKLLSEMARMKKFAGLSKDEE